MNVVCLFSDKLYATAYELGECFATEHTVLQEGKVDKLVYAVACLSVFGKDIVL